MTTGKENDKRGPGRTTFKQASRHVVAWSVRTALVVWGVGFTLFCWSSRPFALSLPIITPHPGERHNLAAARYGPTLRASSYYNDVWNQHHPAFLVDERKEPTKTEKWCSSRLDRSPWIEIRWQGIHTLSEVSIAHGGAFEGADHTSKAYIVTCLQGERHGPKQEIFDNQDNVSRHPFACPGATGIRIDFLPMPRGEMTWVYEVEAWGQ